MNDSRSFGSRGVSMWKKLVTMVVVVVVVVVVLKNPQSSAENLKSVGEAIWIFFATLVS